MTETGAKGVRLPERGYDASRCARCGAKSQVTESRPNARAGRLLRRRVCSACGHRWITAELTVRPGRQLAPIGDKYYAAVMSLPEGRTATHE